MSLQVFLQAQLLGTGKFLESAPVDPEGMGDLMGRCAWLTLICEVLPRALLSELKLSRMLLGSSSAEQFLLVLVEDDIPKAEEFLNLAAGALRNLAGDTLRLVWASTENLGAWPVARKRLEDALQAKISAPLGGSNTAEIFAPAALSPLTHSANFFANFGKGLPSASSVGWSAANPAELTWDGGTYVWPLREQSSIEEDGILFPRRFAMNEAGTQPGSPQDLAERAEGVPQWGVLCGDVDHFELQLRRVGSIEENIHLSELLKQFFAGELAILCTLPEFWRKVTVLYRGGDDFAVFGSWDALILLARELHRLFEKFVEQHLASLPGVEAKSISMAFAIAPEIDTPVAVVFAEAYAQLRTAKSIELGSVHVFGRMLEWKRLPDAEELKTSLVRLVRDYGFSPAYINDLAAVYREASAGRAGRRGKSVRVDKPWRMYMRLSRVIPQGRSKELINLRNTVITNLVGKRTAGLKLRPSARVGLEWARLAAGA